MIRKIKYLSLFLSVIFLSNAFLVFPAKAIDLATQLSGKIVLQVESRGEAWYINPKDKKRYYLGKPEDAYNLMKKLSIGISEKEFASWNKGAPAWAVGGLYIRPQSHGEAYYVDFNKRWNYLGRPIDAWQLFRNKGLGISNSDLAKIPNSSLQSNQTINSVSDYAATFSWKYKMEDFKLSFPLKSSINSSYASSNKVFYYTGNLEPSSAREQFYGLFFNFKKEDSSITELIKYGRQIATSRGWGNDQLLEFLVALIQYIPYDNAKLNQDPMQPNYPYETLYRNSGICSDKTFLTVSVLRALGYGAAILDFPEANHSAAGVSCPLTDSVNNSGYCYIETTNYFPIGVVPSSLSGGRAASNNSLDGIFEIDNLSQMKIFQKTSGNSYLGVSVTKSLVESIKAKKSWIESQEPLLSQKSGQLDAKQNTLTTQRSQLDAYEQSGNISAYNSLVVTYNAGVVEYNQDLSDYREELTVYNNTVKEYNEGLRSFYQQ
jgi:hypothetical protein